MKNLFYIFLTIVLLIPILVNAHAEQDSGMMHEMSGFGIQGLWFWIMAFNFIVWSIVGVFLLAWLWKQLFKK